MSELSWQWGPDPHLPGEGRARESELALQSATHRTPRLALGLHDGPPSCARQVLCSSCRARAWGFGREQGSFSLCPHGACILRSKKGQTTLGDLVTFKVLQGPLTRGLGPDWGLEHRGLGEEGRTIPGIRNSTCKAPVRNGRA